MGLKFNNVDIYAVNFNGTSLTQVNFNDVPVWYALTACSIEGTCLVGYTLSAKTTPSEVQSLCSYQWYRGNTLISGATKDTYDLTVADRGYQLKCVAKIGNATATSELTEIIKQGVVGISLSGVAQAGYTLSTTIAPSEATGTYQWYRDDTAISGATNSTYTLVKGDGAHYVSCTFTGNGNWAGSVTVKTSAKVIAWNGPYSDEKYTNSGSSRAWSVSVDWSFASPGVRLTYAKGGGDNSDKEQNHIYVYVSTSDGKYSYSKIADSGQQDFYASAEWSGTIDNVTYVKCEHSDTLNYKGIRGWITYYTKVQ